MIVVSDTSPIINLAVINQLELLHHLYGEIYISQAVYDEIAIKGIGQPGYDQLNKLPWVKIHEVSNRNLVEALTLELDEGEAESIALAIEKQADLLLIDERKGRNIASKFGLKYVGLLGCLIEAKHSGKVSSLKPLLDDLISKAGFWISSELYKRVLEAVKE